MNTTLQGYLAVVFVLLFVMGFAVGLGAACWAILSEMMPTRVRSKAMSLFLSINWGSNLVIGLLTLTAIDLFGGVKSSMDDDETQQAEQKGVGWLYAFFATVTLVCLLFIQFYVPETKGTYAFSFLYFFISNT